MLEDRAYDSEYLDTVVKKALREVQDYHQRRPLREGVSIRELASRLDIPPALCEKVTTRSALFHVAGDVVSTRDHGDRFDPTLHPAWNVCVTKLEEAYPRVPRIGDLGIEADHLTALADHGRLVVLSDTIAYLPTQMENLGIVRGMSQPFTVSEYATAAGLSRKYAVPILEWADEHRITRRDGDHRYLYAD